MGKFIVIEGTDCSWKETQSKLLCERFAQEWISLGYRSFPMYGSPTGKIIGGPYLWKPSMGECFFPEGAANVDPKVASLYFAADRLYHLPEIEKSKKNQNVILDRYVYSNMAHQGGKLSSFTERQALYQWIEELEFHCLWLPEAEIKILLHMPIKWTLELQKKRTELDQHESNHAYLENAEKAYLEIAEKYDFHLIECGDEEHIKTIGEINDELLEYVKQCL